MALAALFTDIADAIREKDGTTAEIAANAFPARIRGIPAGGGAASVEPLDPVEVYHSTRPDDWLPMPEPQDNEIYLLFHIPDGVSSLLAFTVTCTGSYTVALGTVANGAFVQSSTQTLASGTKYQAELFADDFGSLTSDGMKQCMVKISGTAVKTWVPAAHPKKTAPANFYKWNIMEIVCRLPQGTSITCGNSSEVMALTKLRYFSMAGSSNMANMSSMFRNCYSLIAVLQLNSSKVTSMMSTFNTCYSLIAIPQLDTAKVLSMNGAFNSCYSLVTIPQLNTSRVTDMSSMFNSCYSLAQVPQLDTSQTTNMGSMFYGCYSLSAIPQLDTSKATKMNSMFRNCYSLTTVPELNTSNVTDMSYLFYSCISLTAIPQLNTSKVTIMSSMFRNCYSLTEIPELDMSKAIDLSYMFQACYSLIAIPELDTSNAADMRLMFNACSLIAVPQLDTSNVTNMTNTFNNCPCLGKLTFNPSAAGWAGCAIDIKQCSLGHQALVDLFNSLPAITSAKELTITGNPGVSELTDTEKAIATGKNWTLIL